MLQGAFETSVLSGSLWSLVTSLCGNDFVLNPCNTLLLIISLCIFSGYVLICGNFVK